MSQLVRGLQSFSKYYHFSGSFCPRKSNQVKNSELLPHKMEVAIFKVGNTIRKCAKVYKFPEILIGNSALNISRSWIPFKIMCTLNFLYIVAIMILLQLDNDMFVEVQVYQFILAVNAANIIPQGHCLLHDSERLNWISMQLRKLCKFLNN